MLRRLRVQNFMSLRDTTLDLTPLTVLVGPNSSGKSAVFKALVTLSRLLRQFAVRGPQGEFELEPAVTLNQTVWQGNAGLPIIFEVWLDEDDLEGEPGYRLVILKDTRGWSVSREQIRLEGGYLDTSENSLEFPTERRGLQTWRAPLRGTLSHLCYPYRNDQRAQDLVRPFLEFASRIGQAWRYRPSASDIAGFWAQQSDREGNERVPFVGENGSGLPLVLQRLQGESRDIFEKIEQRLVAIHPHIRFINFQSERLGVRLAFTTHRSQDIVPAPQESDGVLLTTFLLWRLYSAPPDFRVCLEEPENGTHPYLLKERFELLKDFAYGRVGPHPVQLLVSTHSPDFITAIEDKDEALDLVRVVEFEPDSGTKIHRLRDYAQMGTLLDMFDGNLGDLWWSGAIGAVPKGSG